MSKDQRLSNHWRSTSQRKRLHCNAFFGMAISKPSQFEIMVIDAAHLGSQFLDKHAQQNMLNKRTLTYSGIAERTALQHRNGTTLGFCCGDSKNSLFQHVPTVKSPHRNRMTSLAVLCHNPRKTRNFQSLSGNKNRSYIWICFMALFRRRGFLP